MAELENVSVETEVAETTETEVTTEKADDKDKEIQRLRQELDKNKKRLSEVNSESAGYKRQLRDRQSAEEKAEAERLEKQAALEKELADLRKEKSISDYKGRFMGLGFTAEMASDAASAYADGDIDTVFSTFKSYIDEVRNSVAVKAMDSQGGLSVGNPPDAKSFSREDIAGMSASEINANWSEIQKTIKKMR